MHRHLSAIDTSNHCVGGFAFEWNDEWWKIGIPFTQEYFGYPIYRMFPDYKNGATAEVFYGHPDIYANEEHFGLVVVLRNPKPAYSTL